jgi:outer membrane protein assembly factor BamB
VYVLSPASVASGVVYWGNGFEGEVFAFDATSGAALWNSGSTINGAVFGQPLIDKHLFVSSWDHKLYCFGL